ARDAIPAIRDAVPRSRRCRHRSRAPGAVCAEPARGSACARGRRRRRTRADLARQRHTVRDAAGRRDRYGAGPPRTESAGRVRPVWVATALFAVIVSALAADRYVTYHYGADLGLYTQTIYTAFHGFYNQVEHGTHFMVHFSPIYWLCAPIL